MNRCIFLGLFCSQFFNNAIKIIDSDKKVFTLSYDRYSMHFSKNKYIEFIQCMCSSRNSTNLMVTFSGQRKEMDVTDSVKCELDNIPIEKVSIACTLTYARQATYSQHSIGHIDFFVSCKTNESDHGEIKTETIFTLNSDLKCRDKCFHITWRSDGPLNLTYHDLGLVKIHNQSHACRRLEMTTTSTTNVGNISDNYSESIISANYSESLISANYSESPNASNYFRQTSRDKTHSISILAYVLSAIFIGCIVTFFLGVKRISLNTLFRRNFIIIYRKIQPKSRDTDHTTSVNDQEQAFSDPITQTIERLYLRPLVNVEDIVNNHTTFWHRETNSFDVRANDTVSEVFEQETSLNNVLEDNIYADPVMILNLSSNETQTAENQRRISTNIPVRLTVSHEAIQLQRESETNVRYYEVEFQPQEDYDSQTVHETILKSSPESDVTMTIDVDKVYETPQPITDTIYYTLRRKGHIFKHNYECIPLEIDSSHPSLTDNEGSRLSTFYEIAFGEEEDDNRQMIHQSMELISDENQVICVDSEKPLFEKSIYSSLREKRTFKHNYEIIATLMESPCIQLGENLLEIMQEIAEKNTPAENLFDNQPSPEPTSSTDKQHDDIMTSIEGEEDANRYTTLKDVSCTFQDKCRASRI